MYKKINRIIVILLVFAASIVASNNVFADSIDDKWTYTQYYNCAKNYFNGNAYYTTTNETVLSGVVGTKGDLTMRSGTTNCQTLLVENVGVSNPTRADATASGEVLKSLGYEEKVVSTEAAVNYNYAYDTNYGSGSTPSTLVVTIDANGVNASDDGHLRVVPSSGGQSFKICDVSGKCTGEISNSTNTETLKNNISAALGAVDWTSEYDGATYGMNGFNVSTSASSAGYTYPPSGKTVDSIAAETTKNFSGMNLADLNLTDSERYDLYYDYITQYGSLSCGNEATGGSGVYKLKMKTQDGTYQECELKIDGTASDVKVNTITMSGGVPTVTTISLLDVIQWFGTADEEDLENVSESSLAPTDGTVERKDESSQENSEENGGIGADGDAETEDSDVDCQSSGAAQSLGWIVCPILTWMERTSTNLYEDYVEPALVVDPGLFNSGDGVKRAWDTFQTIANVIFSILLLGVILSQLTGFGIDNYGIKKILPKLIAVAILTNLSYYLCLIAVDMSNIVGNGIQALFNGLGEGMSMSVNIDGATKSITSTAVSAVAVLGTMVTMGVAVWANPAILLTLFISAIGVVISILFLFIILAAREAAVVVLVVASPVAMACYLLPNTKKIFDRWLKIFEGLLLVFPICGLLVGGGNYVSKLLLSTGFSGNGVFNAFAAMVVGIVPIFFIPNVLKNSFSAIGNLGTKIAGIGKTVGGGARKVVSGSNLNKTLQEAGAEKRARFMGGLNADGTQRNLSTMGRMIRGGRRNIAKNRAVALGNMDKRFREGRLMGVGYDAALAGMNAKVDKAGIDDAQALIESGMEVNPNDVSAMNYFHANALNDYHNATTHAERTGAMARIQAAQNIMAKTDKGRAGIQVNYENALLNGRADGVAEAASHMMSNYGGQIKNVNRGEFGLLSDLSTMKTDANGNIDSGDYQKVLTNINTGFYNKAGTDKYTPESLVNADELALDRLYSSMGAMNNEERENIQNTARSALVKAEKTNLNIKPEVRTKMEKISQYDGGIGSNGGNGSNGSNGNNGNRGSSGGNRRDPYAGFSEESRRAIEQNGGSLGA